MYISSQRYIDDTIVDAKIAAKDYVVTVTPVFVIDGIEMQAVVDGHHSLAAAKVAGVAPEFVVATVQDDDRIAMLDSAIDDYLEVCYMDSDWYDVDTGVLVF